MCVSACMYAPHSHYTSPYSLPLCVCPRPARAPVCASNHTLGDVTGTNYVPAAAAAGENSCTTDTNPVSEAECEVANLAILMQSTVPAGTWPGRPMQVGAWDHVPPGCSYSTLSGPGGDHSAHFNKRTTGANNTGDYALICSTSSTG